MSATPIHPVDAAIATVSEFPERLGPVLVKELRQGLRSGLFVLPFVILPAALGLVAVWALSIDNLGNARSGVEVCFWVAIVVPVLFIAPLRALAIIRAEREAQTLDLLQLTPLTAWRIVLAKWSSLQAQSVLWVAALLPFLVLRYFFGGMNLTDELMVLVWVTVAGGVLTALGLVVSTLSRLVFWLSLAGMVFLGIVGLISLVSTLLSPRGITRIWIGGGTGSPVADVVMLLMAGHVTYLALTFAGSRIAPVADNYALRLRGGALALFAWFGLASLVLPTPDEDLRWAFFAVAAVATTVFTIIDLAANRTPLSGQVRPFAGWGRLGLFIGRAFLPGWPSAVVFFSGVTVLASALALVESSHGGQFCARALIFWPAVMLPRALQCFFAPGSGDRPALHLVSHLAGPLLAGVIAMFGFMLGSGVLVPATMFPSALWWLVAFEGVDADRHLIAITVAGALWVLGLSVFFVIHSRAYWAQIARHVAAIRANHRP